MSRTQELKFAKVGPFSIVADSDAVVWPLHIEGRRIKVVKAFYGATAAVTAADTNYQTIAIKHGTTTIHSIATGPAATGESLAAGILEEKDLATPVEVPPDTAIKVTFTKAGSGMAVTGLVVGIAYYDYDA